MFAIFLNILGSSQQNVIKKDMFPETIFNLNYSKNCYNFNKYFIESFQDLWYQKQLLLL